MKLTLLLAAVAMLGMVLHAEPASVLSIPVKDIDGKPTTLGALKGKTILVVNVASKCGLTPQYEALEKLHRKYKDKGFTVVGFPCNDFAGQEPGTATEIKAFCTGKYDVTFPLYEKLHVKGPEQHPLYKALSGKESPFPGDVKWNFGKFLVSPEGKIIQRFEPSVTPDSAEIVKAVESAIGAK